MRFKIFLSFIFLTFLSERSLSQCSSLPFPTATCEDAPIVCLDQLCFETLNQPLQGWPGFCGPNTLIHNPQFFQFIPSSSEVEIQIHVDNCDSGNGLQSAIVGECPWEISDVYACDPGTPPGGTMVLIASGLVIGQPAWLLIDGSNGSTCHYTITFADGIEQTDLDGELTQVTAFADDTIVPQGFDNLILEAEPAIGYAHGYYWVVGWSGDTLTSSDTSILLDIPCDVPAGIYPICVRAYSGCDTTDYEVCIQIEIQEQPDVFKEPASFCPEAFPFFWANDIITGPGTYIQTFNTEFGCPHDSIWMIDAYPEVPVGQIDTFVCDYEFNYEGVFYDHSGMYIIDRPGQGLNGCDSVTDLNLTLHAVDLFIESTSLDSVYTLIPHVIEHTLPHDILAYSWYDCNYDSLLSTAGIFTPDSSGCYCLVVDHGFCSDTICSTFIDPSESDCTLVQESGCTGQPIAFNYTGEIQEGAYLHWLIDGPGSPGEYYSGFAMRSLIYDTPGCYLVSFTIVDSNSTFTCRDSFCIDSTTSTASLCCDETKCDTCTTLSIELAGASPWTVYISSVLGTDTLPAIQFSTVSYLICPPPDSTVIYSIYVTDSVNVCPANINGEESVSITLFSVPEALLIQIADTLCVNLPNMLSYHWYACGSNEILTTTQCFIPPTSGCYCAEVTNAGGCVDTICDNFIISATRNIDTLAPKIYPVPSKGAWQIRLPEGIALPVTWSLVDLSGKMIRSGSLADTFASIVLTEPPPAGLYYIQFISGQGKMTAVKVVIE